MLRIKKNANINNCAHVLHDSFDERLMIHDLVVTDQTLKTKTKKKKKKYLGLIVGSYINARAYLLLFCVLVHLSALWYSVNEPA